MDIRKKIEEIRKKPEHIRERYLWACVGICMIIILGIWTLSFKNQFNGVADEDTRLKDSLDSAKQMFEDASSSQNLNK